jgi:hypothetical protein
VQFNTRRRTSSISTSKSASTAPKPTRQPKSSLSSTSSTSPETAPTQRKSLKKKKSPESEASVVVTPKTLPRKRQKKSPLPPASKYQGVSYSKDDKKYLAQIEYNHKFHSLGVYKFEADAALAYDMGYKLLLKHPQDDVASAAAVAAPHAASRNFVRRESYEDNIREAMKNANRKRINVEKSYSKVSGSVGVYVSKIFAAEENKLRESLDNEKSGDDDNTDFENATTNHGNVDTNTEFEFAISAPSMSNDENSVPTSQRRIMAKNKKPRDSLDDFQSGDDVDDLEHALNNNDDGGFNASTEFEDFEFTISTPATIVTAVETNIEHDDGTIARLRVEENSVPSPQCKTIMKTHACSSVEYDQVCKRFIAYITLPKSEIKYSLGKTVIVSLSTSCRTISNALALLPLLSQANTNLKPMPPMPATKRQHSSR